MSPLISAQYRSEHKKKAFGAASPKDLNVFAYFLPPLEISTPPAACQRDPEKAHFTAPVLSPETKSFWKRKKTTTTGRIDIVVPAMISP